MRRLVVVLFLAWLAAPAAGQAAPTAGQAASAPAPTTRALADLAGDTEAAQQATVRWLVEAGRALGRSCAQDR